MARRIPAVITVDVEPAGFQLQQEPAGSTLGYDALVDVVSRLRPRIADVTGQPPSFGWYFRMDPQIASLFGRADHLVHGFGDRVARLREAGDHVGLHTHPVRWSDRRQAWEHDVTDAAWVDHAYSTAFSAFERCFGFACERHRVGAALINQHVVDSLIRAGASVELGLEPVRGSVAEGRDIKTGVDISPLAAPGDSCAAAPRRAYRPAPGDFRRGGGPAGGLVLLPASTTRLRPRGQTLRSIAGTLKRQALPTVSMLYADRDISPVDFWDLVAWQLRLMRRPYLNLAVRTDAPGTRELTRVSALLDALPGHPLARRIRVVDPLVALQEVLGETTVRAAAA